MREAKAEALSCAKAKPSGPGGIKCPCCQPHLPGKAEQHRAIRRTGKQRVRADVQAQLADEWDEILELISESADNWDDCVYWEEWL